MSVRHLLPIPFTGLFVVACGGSQPAMDDVISAESNTTEHASESPMPEHLSDGSGHHDHAAHTAHSPGHQHRFDDPAAYASRWESPERDAWQMPDDLVAALGVEPGMTVADLGTGTGYLLGRLSAAVGDGGTVYAVDVEQAMIDWVTTRVAEQGWQNVETVLAPYDGPGVDAESLDRAVMVNVWHHIEDRGAYASATFEAVKPGGVLMIVETKVDAEAGPPVHYRLAPETVMAELEAAGFAVELSPYENVQQYAVIGRRPQ
jgi:SAM-dependent methyltransferase